MYLEPVVTAQRVVETPSHQHRQPEKQKTSCSVRPMYSNGLTLNSSGIQVAQNKPRVGSDIDEIV